MIQWNNTNLGQIKQKNVRMLAFGASAHMK